jgi:pimeloyl-ACP methyl ester carboxylesterase
MRVARRPLTLGLAAAFASRTARGDAPDDDPLELRTLRLEHEVLFALPRAPSGPVPLVVLLHGLGETSDERAGSRAWVDRYGLATSVRRLKNAPLARVSSRDDWGSALAAANAALAARPYRGLAFACPFVPRSPKGGLDAYAKWIDGVVIPRVRAEAGERIDPAPARIGGCSYGGWVSLEVFLRLPHRFAAWAGVQTAIGREAAGAYADRLATVAGGCPLLVETSVQDPFHDASVALAGQLRARNVGCELLVLPGPHDQPWLRESGTPSAVAWLDRV